jgi:hypothetical protein
MWRVGKKSCAFESPPANTHVPQERTGYRIEGGYQPGARVCPPTCTSTPQLTTDTPIAPPRPPPDIISGLPRGSEAWTSCTTESLLVGLEWGTVSALLSRRLGQISTPSPSPSALAGFGARGVRRIRPIKGRSTIPLELERSISLGGASATWS